MKRDLTLCTSLIEEHFQLTENELKLQNQDFDALEQKLAALINNLLNTDLPRLMNAFYRIDLDEEIFKQIMTQEPPDQINFSLAKAVIKREIMKVETRKKYRDN